MMKNKIVLVCAGLIIGLTVGYLWFSSRESEVATEGISIQDDLENGNLDVGSCYVKLILNATYIIKDEHKAVVFSLKELPENMGFKLDWSLYEMSPSGASRIDHGWFGYPAFNSEEFQPMEFTDTLEIQIVSRNLMKLFPGIEYGYLPKSYTDFSVYDFGRIKYITIDTTLSSPVLKN